MSTIVAKPVKVAITSASGTYGKGILARAEDIGVEALVVTRSPHKFQDVEPTTTVLEAQLDDEEKLKEVFTGCDGVISALGDDRKKRPNTHNLPHVWNAMKAVGVSKCIGMGSGAIMMPGNSPDAPLSFGGGGGCPGPNIPVPDCVAPFSRGIRPRSTAGSELPVLLG